MKKKRRKGQEQGECKGRKRTERTRRGLYHEGKKEGIGKEVRE